MPQPRWIAEREMKQIRNQFTFRWNRQDGKSAHPEDRQAMYSCIKPMLNAGMNEKQIADWVYVTPKDVMGLMREFDPKYKTNKKGASSRPVS